MIRMYPRYLWLLMVAYVFVILLANWFAARLMVFGPVIIDAGTIAFPFTFLIVDLITEVYGYKNARLAIWVGFSACMMFILYGQLVIHLPGPPNYPLNDELAHVTNANARIIFASLVSYLCAEPLNSLVMAKLKIKWQGRYMALRFVASTTVAVAADSTIFCTLAFGGIITNRELVIMILGLWGIKVLVEICGLPLSTWLARRLKQKEQIDIYDINTQFNLFKLDAQYPTGNNRFK